MSTAGGDILFFFFAGGLGWAELVGQEHLRAELFPRLLKDIFASVLASYLQALFSIILSLALG